METIEGIAKAAGHAAKQGAADVARDVGQSLGGGTNEDLTQGAKTLPAQQKSQIKADDTQKAQAIRQNIARMNQEILELKKQKDNKADRDQQKQVQEKQVKRMDEQKKESMLAKLIKSRKGTKEGVNRMSG